MNGFDPWVGKIPWRREWQPTPVFLPRELHERGAWWATVHGVAKQSDKTEQLTLPFSLSHTYTQAMVRSTTNWKMGVPLKGIQIFRKTLHAKQSLWVESDLLTIVCNPCGPKFLLTSVSFFHKYISFIILCVCVCVRVFMERTMLHLNSLFVNHTSIS